MFSVGLSSNPNSTPKCSLPHWTGQRIRTAQVILFEPPFPPKEYIFQQDKSVSVALGIQNSKLTQHTVIRGLPECTVFLHIIL